MEKWNLGIGDLVVDFGWLFCYNILRKLMRGEEQETSTEGRRLKRNQDTMEAASSNLVEVGEEDDDDSNDYENTFDNNANSRLDKNELGVHAIDEDDTEQGFREGEHQMQGEHQIAGT